MPSFKCPQVEIMLFGSFFFEMLVMGPELMIIVSVENTPMIINSFSRNTEHFINPDSAQPRCKIVPPPVQRWQ